MALDKVVTHLLRRFLGSFIELEDDSIKLSIWSGAIHLKNVAIKPAALADLHPAIAFKSGFVTNIQVDVPFRSLGSKPITVQLNDVYALAAPKSQVTYTKKFIAEELQRMLNKKLETLKAWDMDKETIAEVRAENAKEGMLEKLIATALANLRIDISNIHIRIEDSASPFSIGVVLHSLQVLTADRNWEPVNLTYDQLVAQRDPKDPRLRKLGLVQGFGVYFDSKFTNVCKVSENINAFLELMKSSMIEDHQWVLRPFELKLHLRTTPTFQPVPGTNLAAVSAEAVLDELSLKISTLQVNTLLSQIEYWVNFGTYSALHLRPESSVTEDPKAFWRYAISAVQLHLKEQAEFDPSSQSIGDRLISWKNQQIYVPLYKRHRGSLFEAPLNSKEEKLVAKMESELSLNQILAYRKLAVRQLDAEYELNPNLYAEFERNSEGKINEEKRYKAVAKLYKKHPPRFLTEDELYELEYNYTNKINLLTKATATQKTIEASLLLKKLSLAVTDAQACREELQSFECGFSVKEKPLIDLEIDKIAGSLVMYGASIQIDASVKDINITDRFTPENLFKQILAVHKNKLHDQNRNFIDAHIELPPIDKHSAVVVKAYIAPIAITVTPYIISSLIDAFVPKPGDAADLISNASTGLQFLADLTANQFADLSSYSPSNVSNLLFEHETFDLDIELSAPSIVIPFSHKSLDCQRLFMDFGKLTVTSDLSTSSKVLYDVYKIAITEFRVCLTEDLYDYNFMFEPDMTLLPSERSAKTESATIFNPLSLEINIAVSICPSNINVDRIKVNGRLDAVDINLSTCNIAYIITLANQWIQFLVPVLGLSAAPSIEDTFNDELVSIQDHSFNQQEIDESEISESEQPAVSMFESFFKKTGVDTRAVAAFNILKLNFDFASLSINIIQQDSQGAPQFPFMRASLDDLHFDMAMQPYGQTINVSTGSLFVGCPMMPKAEQVILATYGHSHGQSLLDFKMLMMSPLHPDFSKVEIDMDIKVNKIEVSVRPKIISKALYFVDWILTSIEELDLSAFSAPEIKAVDDVEMSDNDQESLKTYEKELSRRGLTFSDVMTRITNKHSYHSTKESKLDLKLNLVFSGISLSIFDYNAPLAKLLISDGKASIEMAKYSLVVSASLGSIVVTDLLSSATIYPEILRAVGDHNEPFLIADVMMASPLSSLWTGTDMNVSVKMGGKPTIVVNLPFLINTANIFINIFTEHEAIASSIAQGASNSMNNVSASVSSAATEALAQDMIMVLDIHLEAPSIIVPRFDSQSASLTLNLGTLRISTDHEVEQLRSSTICYQSLNLLLNGVGSIVPYPTHPQITTLSSPKIVDLHPLEISIKQSLNTIYKKVNDVVSDIIDIPLVDINVNAPSLEFSLNTIQYDLLMDILDDNIMVGLAQLSSVEIEGGALSVPLENSVKLPAAPIHIDERPSLNLTAFIGSISLMLFGRRSHLIDPKLCLPLSHLIASGIDATVNIQNGDIGVSARLGGLRFLDLRPEALIIPQYRTLIHAGNLVEQYELSKPCSTTESSSDRLNFIEAEILVKPDEISIDTKIAKMRLLANPDTLLTIMYFFTGRVRCNDIPINNGSNSLQISTNPFSDSSRKSRQRSNSSSSNITAATISTSRKSCSSLSGPVMIEPDPINNSPKINIKFDIESVGACVVTNIYDPSVKSLSVALSLTGDVSIINDLISVSVDVHSLSAATVCPSYRTTDKRYNYSTILRPCSLAADVKLEKSNIALSVLMVDEFRIRLSFMDVTSLMQMSTEILDILTTHNFISASPEEAARKLSEMDKPKETIPGFDPVPFFDNEVPVNQQAQQDSTENESLITVSVNIPHVAVMLIDNTLGTDIPLVELVTGLSNCGIKLLNDNLTLNAVVDIASSYYNPKLNIWEPLFEQTSLVVTILSKEASHSTAALSLDAFLKKPLQVDISHSLLSTLLTTAISAKSAISSFEERTVLQKRRKDEIEAQYSRTLKEAYDINDPAALTSVIDQLIDAFESEAPIVKFAYFYGTNNIGVPINLTLYTYDCKQDDCDGSNADLVLRGTSSVAIAAGETVILDFVGLDELQHADPRKIQQMKFGIQVNSTIHSGTHVIMVDRVGVSAYDFVRHGGVTDSLIIKNYIEERSKHISIQSLNSVTNQSNHELTIKFTNEQDSSIVSIAPGSSAFCPITMNSYPSFSASTPSSTEYSEFVPMRNFSYQIKPSEGKYRLSDSSKILERKYSPPVIDMSPLLPINKGEFFLNISQETNFSDVNDAHFFVTTNFILSDPLCIHNKLPWNVTYKIREVNLRAPHDTTASRSYTLESGQTMPISDFSCWSALEMAVLPDTNSFAALQATYVLISHGGSKYNRIKDLDTTYRFIDATNGLSFFAGLNISMDKFNCRNISVNIPYYISNQSNIHLNFMLDKVEQLMIEVPDGLYAMGFPSSDRSSFKENKAKMKIRADGISQWSDPFCPSNAGLDGDLPLYAVKMTAEDSYTKSDILLKYSFGYSISLYPKDDALLVTIFPKAAVRNNTSLTLKAMVGRLLESDISSKKSPVLPPKERFFFTNVVNNASDIIIGPQSVDRVEKEFRDFVYLSADPMITKASNPDQSSWSAGLPIYEPGHYSLKVPNGETELLFDVDISLINGQFIIMVEEVNFIHPVINPVVSKLTGRVVAPAYMISNETNYPCVISQALDENPDYVSSAVNRQIVIPPNSRASYALDEPADKQKAVSVVFSDDIHPHDPVKGTVHLNTLKAQNRLYGHGYTVVPYLEPLGPISVLRLIPVEDPLLAVPYLGSAAEIDRHRRSKVTKEPLATSREVLLNKKSVDDVINLAANLFIPTIGVSVFTENSEELLNLTICGISIKVIDSMNYTSGKFEIGAFQLDHLDKRALFPVPLIFNPTANKTLSEKVSELNRPDSISAIDDLPVIRAEVVLCKDFEYVVHLKMVSLTTLPLEVNVDGTLLGNMMNYVSILPDLSLLSDETEKKQVRLTAPTQLYIENLILNTLAITATLDIEDFLKSINLPSVVSPFASTLAHLERAQIRFDALIIEDAFLDQNELINRLVSVYTKSAIQQAFKLMGSLSFIGNPTALLSSVGSGVMGAVMDPYAAMKADADISKLGAAFYHSTANLASQSVYGAANVGSSIIGSVGRAIAPATFDPVYQQHRKGLQKKSKSSVLGAAENTAVALPYGVASGVAGLFYQPVVGAKRDGFKGFGKGVGKGLAGVFVKPFVGLADSSAGLFDAIKNSSGAVQNVYPLRGPREVGSQGQILALPNKFPEISSQKQSTNSTSTMSMTPEDTSDDSSDTSE